MWTYGKNSLPQQFTRRALATVFLMLTASAAFAQSAAVDAFNAMGFQKNRNYFSPEPYEHYDTVSGNVLLTFTDLTLPGNAGRSLQIQRTYNNQRVGLPGGGLAPRWSIGLAGMVMHIVEADPVPVGFNFNDDPRLITFLSPTFIMADNGRHPTMPVVLPNTSNQGQIDSTMRTVISGEFHKYDRQTHTLYMADGTVAHYCENGVDPVTQRPMFSLEWFEDLFENRVTLDYADETIEIRQDLGNSQVRVVTLGRVNGRVESMTFLGRVWQYGYDHPSGEMDSVTLPVGGLGWTFDYQGGDLTEITTPNGGRIEYSWDDVLVEPVPGDPSQNFTRHFLHFRKSWDRNGAPLGTWTLTWGNQFDDPISFGATIELPSGVKVGFGNGALTTTPGLLFTGGFGLAQRLILDAGGQLIERESLSFVAVPVIRYSSSLWWGTPELSQRTVTRGTRTYSTQWTYATSVASAASFPWNNHHPTSIVENNNEGLGRTTNRTYVHRPVAPGATTLAAYVLGLPETESVTVGAETYSRSWQYDASGFTQQYSGFGRAGASGIVRTFTPDSQGNVATASTATASTSYSYEWGVVKDTATAEHTISRTINIDGTVQSETTAGRTTAFVYDDLGRPTLVTPPGGTNPTTTVYALDGTTVTTTRGPLSLITSLDAFGRPTGTVNSQGVQTTTRYDAEGRVTYRSLPFYGSADVGTAITYDALDRVKRETHADSTYREYTYGPDTTTIVDEDGRTTVHRFVAFGHPDDARLAIVTDAKQQPWAYAYDVLGRIRNVTASDGTSRTWEYNDQGLLFRETHPESGITTYQYNAGGSLTQKTDAKGQTFVYTYDGNDRVRTVTVGSELTTFTYEAGSDNRKSMSVDGVHTEFGYDAAGRRASRVDTVDGFKFTTTFGYDNDDNLTSISYPSFGTSGNRRQIGYEYDSERRLTLVRDLLASRDFATNFSHHASGALLGYTAGNGVPSTFTYHPSRYWMTSLNVGSHWSLQYSNYDDVGNVRSLVDSRAGMNQDLVYDELDRLVSLTGGAAFPSASWAYDIHGNRTNANGTTYTYYPGTLRLWTQNTDTYTYDNNGNLLTGTTPGRTFTYTAWNRVASATMGGTTTNYRYDADDWRVKKSSGTTTTYLLRGLNGELLTEWKSTETNGETRDYIYAGDRLIGAVERDTNPLPTLCGGTAAPNGSPQSLTIASGETGSLSFEGSACRRVSALATTTSGSYGCVWSLTVKKPDGASLPGPGTSCGTTLFMEPVTLPVSGQYSAVVDPAGTGSGSVNVQLFDVVDLTGAIVPDGTPVTVPITTPGQRGLLTFIGTAGSKVSVAEALSTSACATIRIYKPDETILSSTTACGANNFQAPVTLPVAGQYTLSLDPNAQSLMTITARMWVVTDHVGSIEVDGPAVSVALSTPGQKSRLTFNGTQGWRVSAVETVSACASVRIYKPDMTVLASAYACPSVSFQEPVTLPVTGTYVLELYDEFGATLTATAQIYNVVDHAGSINVGGSAVSVPLNTPGQKARLTFDGTQGWRVSAVETTSACASVRIYKPDLTVLSSSNVCPPGGFQEPVTLPVTGTYVLELDPVASATLTVTAQLYAVVDYTDTVSVGGSPVTVPLPTPGQGGDLTMAGTAGQSVTVRLTGNSISPVIVKLLKPDGTVLAQTTGFSASFNLAPQTLPATGTYVVRLDPLSSSTGSITVSVTSP